MGEINVGRLLGGLVWLVLVGIYARGGSRGVAGDPEALGAKVGQVLSAAIGFWVMIGAITTDRTKKMLGTFLLAAAWAVVFHLLRR